MLNVILTGVVSFIITSIAAPIIIPILKRLKFGQSIREIGPSWHEGKKGTPTMGGIIFIAAITIVALIFSMRTPTIIFLVAGALAFGAIGFLDDYIKVVLKRNLGLRAWQKFSLQLIAAVIFVVCGMHFGILDSEIYIPFTKILVNFDIFYIPFAVFVILAEVNGVNLTDGIDGLASSVTAVIMLFFAAMLFLFGNLDGALYATAVLGGLLGFLLYNKNPAKVFMGDTGSLFLGGVVAALALLLKQPFLLIPMGIIYIAEAASVVIQVLIHKFFGKRVFKMSPIHHHFELCGWKENKIVKAFCLVTFVASAISLIAVVILL